MNFKKLLGIGLVLISFSLSFVSANAHASRAAGIYNDGLYLMQTMGQPKYIAETPNQVAVTNDRIFATYQFVYPNPSNKGGLYSFNRFGHGYQVYGAIPKQMSANSWGIYTVFQYPRNNWLNGLFFFNFNASTNPTKLSALIPSAISANNDGVFMVLRGIMPATDGLYYIIPGKTNILLTHNPPYDIAASDAGVFAIYSDGIYFFNTYGKSRRVANYPDEFSGNRYGLYAVYRTGNTGVYFIDQFGNQEKITDSIPQKIAAAWDGIFVIFNDGLYFIGGNSTTRVGNIPYSFEADKGF